MWSFEYTLFDYTELALTTMVESVTKKSVSSRIAQLVERLPVTLKVPGSNPSRAGSKKKREAGSRVITPPTSPLSRVGRYKAGSGWCM